MASKPKGAYTRAPVFNGENYGYWKDCMRVHITSVDRHVWTAIQDGPFQITMVNAAGAIVPKPENTWNEDDEKKYASDWKGRNMLISALGVDEYYRVSHCTTAKEMWDALEVAHEGTSEVKQSRINTLNQEFELFRMKQGESISEMQKRFIHLTGRLNALGRPVSNENATNKILRCLRREWQPKVTAIKEANDLTTLTITSLFGMLEEHEQQLQSLENYENKSKKEKNRDKEVEKKPLALKASSSKSSKIDKFDDDSTSDEDSDDEEMGLFVQRYNRYIRRNGIKHSDKNLAKFRRQSTKSKQEESKKYRGKGSCFNCGKSGHYKTECPKIKKEKGPVSKKSNKQRRAYIAWESDSESSTDEDSSDDDESANLCLMAHDYNQPHHKKKSDQKKVRQAYYNNFNSLTFSELKIAFEKLHKEAVEAFKRLSSDKQIFSHLEGKVYKAEQDLKDLKASIAENTKNIDGCIETRYCGVCHIWQQEVKTLNAKLEKALQPKVTFAIDPTNFKKTLNPPYAKYSFVEKIAKDSISKSKQFHHHGLCHYCCRKGHTIEKCKFRRFLVPKGIYQWKPKDNHVTTYPIGPNENWVPTSLF
ncbi:uncharacterized protein LOC131640543 [Vicia villosa]|uniref:uncharacterized protein LOC131640543 n=1 Tax=Vicia villosa TaxID=3911 RepID=UPI00273AC204|nr:uncharacterized protein LOC131640543 [Vicia villosa]